MAAAAGPSSGRKAFRGMAPKGYRLRMMEPGEAEALLAIRQASGERGEHQPEMADFVRLLLGHEIYVAVAKHPDRPVGYAVAGGLGAVYWLVEQRVHTNHRGRGIATALLEAVTQRARWFDYHALALCSPVARHGDASFWDELGFTPASQAELPPRPVEGPMPPAIGGTVMMKRL